MISSLDVSEKLSPVSLLRFSRTDGLGFKMSQSTQEMAERHKASDASLRYGVHISPYDLQQLDQGAQEQEEGIVPDSTLATDNEEIPMIDPQGNPVFVHREDKEMALKQGYKEE